MLAKFPRNSSKDAPDDQSLEETYRRRLAIEEFLIDFLGGLLPGILFLGATTFALLPPLYALATTLAPPGEVRPSLFQAMEKMLQATKDTPSTIWFMVLAGGALVAFITGHLFYRQDPTHADKSSFRWLMRKSQSKCDKRRTLRRDCADCAEKRKTELGCAKVDDCEFPYPYMHDYLKQRGLKHLLPFILWRSKESESYRSKRYTDILKIRLRHHYPDKCGTIIRNEAHVRLASSTWYVAGILFWIGVLGLLPAVASVVQSRSDMTLSSLATNISWHAPAILAPLVVSMFSAYSWWAIRRFLHYQRLREIIFVLETAFTAFRENFKLLIPPFTELEELDETPSRDEVAPATGVAIGRGALSLQEAGDRDDSQQPATPPA